MLNLEIPEGQVPLNSPFYVERPPIETNCYEAIANPNALIRIKAPRQMGKTSLVSRILNDGKQQEYQTAYINLQFADTEFLDNLDRFLQWFCASVAEALDLEENLEKYWKGILGSNRKCTKYFKQHILSRLDTPLVLGLDEVDRIFQYPVVALDFFGLLRAWHEAGKNEPIWQKLRLVISHSREVYIPLNINQSPFNVGIAIELPELTRPQVQDLIERYNLQFTDSQCDRLMALLGGHPYLVRVALHHITKDEMSLESLLELAPTEEGVYYNHLRRHLSNLEKDEKLMAALREVIVRDRPVEISSDESFKLRSMGLVKSHGNAVVPLCELYRLYFLGRTIIKPEPKIESEPTKEKRKFAAIVFTDIVNSTILMQKFPKEMPDYIKRDFQIIGDICQKYEGVILNTMGDGLLISFSSVVLAVECAREIQKEIAMRSIQLKDKEVLEHRIGIHAGEIYSVENTLGMPDALGLVVNIASRLQGQAEPGGICISQTVYSIVKDHIEDLSVHDMGIRELKNVTKRIQLYRVNPK